MQRLVHPPDNKKLYDWLCNRVTQLGASFKDFDSWNELEQETFYNVLCDCIIILTLIHSCARISEVEQIPLAQWEDGIMSTPLNGENLNKT
jgi:hypothetical protein